MLSKRAKPDRIRQKISRLVPPHSKNFFQLFHNVLLTHTPIGIIFLQTLYLWGYGLVNREMSCFRPDGSES